MVGLTEQRMVVKLYLLLCKHFAETVVMLKYLTRTKPYILKLLKHTKMWDRFKHGGISDELKHLSEIFYEMGSANIAVS